LWRSAEGSALQKNNMLLHMQPAYETAHCFDELLDPPPHPLSLLFATHPQVLGSISTLAALPHLAALRIDSCRDDAGGVPLGFWKGACCALVHRSACHACCPPSPPPPALHNQQPGLSHLSRLQWLSLGYFESAHLPPFSHLPRLRALQLRSLIHPPTAASLAEALAPLPCLQYLAIEGSRLDGVGVGAGVGVGVGVGGSWLSPSAGDFVTDALDIVQRGR